jgi:hypothetical protein
MPPIVIEREIPGPGKMPDAELRAVSRKAVGAVRAMGTP